MVMKFPLWWGTVTTNIYKGHIKHHCHTLSPHQHSLCCEWTLVKGNTCHIFNGVITAFNTDINWIFHRRGQRKRNFWTVCNSELLSNLILFMVAITYVAKYFLMYLFIDLSCFVPVRGTEELYNTGSRFCLCVSVCTYLRLTEGICRYLPELRQ